MGLVTESVQSPGAQCRDPGAQFLSISRCLTWEKRGIRGKKPVSFDTLPRCPRLVRLTITLIRVTCAGSHRLSHLQHSATTTLRLPEGIIQISHRQQSGKISGGGQNRRTDKTLVCFEAIWLDATWASSTLPPLARNQGFNYGCACVWKRGDGRILKLRAGISYDFKYWEWKRYVWKNSKGMIFFFFSSLRASTCRYRQRWSIGWRRLQSPCC